MDINNLTIIKIQKIKQETIKFTKKTRLWCQLPYKNHKKCPNYNKNLLCPPNSPYLSNIVNDYNYFYLIYADFNFKQYKQGMGELHPNWTESQCGNLLYWQSQIKKLLKNKISQIINIKKYILGCGSGFGKKIYSMESVGIDVMSTLKNNNIVFELKPKSKVILVCLVCLNEFIKFRTQKKLKGMIKNEYTENRRE